MVEISRKSFLGMMAASVVAGAAGPIESSSARTIPAAAKPAKGRKTLVRSVDLLSMHDSQGGEQRSVDVLIDGERIAEIGKNIAVGDAHVIDAKDMILMPGMIDSHRHTWESILNGVMVKTSRDYRRYFEYVNMKVGVSYRPEDVQLANYLGGLMAIDTGVTSVIDHAHVTHTREKGEAVALGLKASGIGGFCCYQISYTPTYETGHIPYKMAYQEFMGPPDAWHLEHAAKIRDKYFSSSSDPLQFGVALSHVEYYPRTVETVRNELIQARKLEAKLMTQHIQGQNGDWAMGLPATYRVIPDLAKAGLLGPDYHISHGNGLSDDELGMLRDHGSKLASSTLGEFPYEFPSIHGRAWKAGVPTGIGVDVPLAVPSDFFEHVRASWLSLFRTPEGRKIVSDMESADILQFATIGGARALGIDSQTGSIAVGKRADLLLLRTDRIGFPNTGRLADRVVTFATLGDIDSVWTNGQLRKSGGHMIGVDMKDLKAKASVARDYIIAKADQIEFDR